MLPTWCFQLYHTWIQHLLRESKHASSCKISPAQGREQSFNFCEHFEQRPNFASTLKLNGSIRAWHIFLVLFFLLHCTLLSERNTLKVIFSWFLLLLICNKGPESQYCEHFYSTVTYGVLFFIQNECKMVLSLWYALHYISCMKWILNCSFWLLMEKSFVFVGCSSRKRDFWEERMFCCAVA